MDRAPSRAVLVTGCSSGIGRATAERLLAGGWTVYATARREETLADLAGRGARTLALDVCDERSMAAAVERVVAEEGAVGALVNNAGYALEGPIETVALDAVRSQFETNVFGLVRMCQLVLPGMRAQGWGRIVNISSMAGRFTLPGGGFYHASKHAVEAISDALRFEVRPFGIAVSVIQPGPILTEFATNASMAAPEGPYARLMSAVHATFEDAYHGRMKALAGSPDAVAKTIEHALGESPRSRYRVTAAARAMITTRKLMPDRAWDAILRAQTRA